MSENQEIAGTIINQMGGVNKLSAMLGIKNLMAVESGIKFQFKGCRKSNLVQIKLNEMDLYTVEFYRLNMRKAECPLVTEIEGVYAEDLINIFEHETNLALRLS